MIPNIHSVYRFFCAFATPLAATLKPRRVCVLNISCEHFPWTATNLPMQRHSRFQSSSACACCKVTQHYLGVFAHSLAVFTNAMRKIQFNLEKNCANYQNGKPIGSNNTFCVRIARGKRFFAHTFCKH